MRTTSMKKPIGIQALYAASLLSFALSSPVHAELKALKQQAIVEDAITPEADEAQDEEVVIVKKRPKSAASISNSNTNNVQAIAVATAPAAEKPSMGSQLDAGIKSKMGDV